MLTENVDACTKWGVRHRGPSVSVLLPEPLIHMTSFVYSMQPLPPASAVGSTFSRAFRSGLGGWARCARNDCSTVRRAGPPAARSGTSGPHPEQRSWEPACPRALS